MTKPEANIKCTHCGYAWPTDSQQKNATCPSCQLKTLNPAWLKANDIKLYRLWSWDSNDRSEFARAIAGDFETVQEWALKRFIKPECQKEIELTDMGLEWSRCEDCKTDPEFTEESCDYCEDSLEGIQIEEQETPDGQSWGETFEFKTIMGTNDFYDLTNRHMRKSKDWNILLSRSFAIAPQVGCDMLTGLTKLAIKEGTDIDKSETVKEIDRLAGYKAKRSFNKTPKPKE